MPPVVLTRVACWWCAVSVFAAMGTILIFSPGALIAVIPLAFLFVKIAQLFTIAGREMKRLESLAFSPILSHLGESLQVRVPFLRLYRPWLVLVPGFRFDAIAAIITHLQCTVRSSNITGSDVQLSALCHVVGAMPVEWMICTDGL